MVVVVVVVVVTRVHTQARQPRVRPRQGELLLEGLLVVWQYSPLSPSVSSISCGRGLVTRTLPKAAELPPRLELHQLRSQVQALEWQPRPKLALPEPQLQAKLAISIIPLTSRKRRLFHRKEHSRHQLRAHILPYKATTLLNLIQGRI